MKKFLHILVLISVMLCISCSTTKNITLNTTSYPEEYQYFTTVIDSPSGQNYNEEMYRFNGDKLEKVEQYIPSIQNDIYVLSTKNTYNDNELNKMNGNRLLSSIVRKDNVSVNLSIDNEFEKSEYTTLKLSVKINVPANVEIFIPLPIDTIFDYDDLNYVFIKKEPCKEYDMMYLSTMQSRDTGFMFYSLKDNIPYDIIIKYVDDGDNSGIKINTFRINQNVLNIMYNYNKSIEFEVYNFFKLGTDIKYVKKYIDKSTIRFLNTKPRYFINTFIENSEDCKVEPINN